MQWETLVALPVLALVDSTSVGTLLLPAWLLLAPRVRPRAVLGYLAVVAGAYLLIGLALLAGAGVVADALEGASAEDRPRVLVVVQLVAGAALLGWALLPDRWRRRRRTPAPDGAEPQPGRLVRWRDRAASGDARGGLLVLAAVAVLLEAATMLPYLGAVALLASSGVGTGGQVLLLVGYCLVMVAPGLLLVAARVLAARRVEPVLRRLERWGRTAGGEAVLWVAGIAGFLLVRDAVAVLGLL
jgi:hypothetical protein